MLNLKTIHPAFHPAFEIYKAEPKPLTYTVSSFEFDENEHYFKVFYDSELVAEVGEVIIPKSRINEWFKDYLPEVLKAYSYKEDGEEKVNWEDLYMDKFDIDCKLITIIANDILNAQL